MDTGKKQTNKIQDWSMFGLPQWRSCAAGYRFACQAGYDGRDLEFISSTDDPERRQGAHFKDETNRNFNYFVAEDDKYKLMQAMDP